MYTSSSKVIIINISSANYHVFQAQNTQYTIAYSVKKKNQLRSGCYQMQQKITHLLNTNVFYCSYTYSSFLSFAEPSHEYYQTFLMVFLFLRI